MTALVRIGETPAMALCEICPEPGYCCSGFVLEEGGHELTFWKDNWEADANVEMERRGHPFKAREIRETFRDDAGWEYVGLRYDCPKLDERGRCSIYATRPEVCRAYRPGSNSLCAFGPPRT